MNVEGDMDASHHPRDLRAALDADVPSVDHLRDAHVAAMVRAFDASVNPTKLDAPVRARRAPRLRMIGIAAAAALLTTGSALAATDQLPGPVQRAVSRAADHVGLNVPSGRSTDAPQPASTPVPMPAAARPPSPPAVPSPNAARTTTRAPGRGLGGKISSSAASAPSRAATPAARRAANAQTRAAPSRHESAQRDALRPAAHAAAAERAAPAGR
jgi:hypothetical protein